MSAATSIINWPAPPKSVEAALDSSPHLAYFGKMTLTTEVADLPGRVAEFLQHVESGNEVLLTRNHEPVARIVPVPAKPGGPPANPPIKSFKGHRVLTPVISQAELADEMFTPK
jgi:antitoxin (DNA-binding transcriptional repressor) of toxin-antitoxin stability system